MPFERAISSRYGQAPSKPSASSRIRRQVAAGDGLAEQLVGGVRAAVAEPVGAVRVAGETDRTGDVGGDHEVTAVTATRSRRERTAMTARTTTATGHDALADDDGRGRQRAVDERR